MRSERFAMGALALALAACAITDPGRPIGLIADRLDEIDRANLEEAAACWNLRFGTQLLVGEDAARADQFVEAIYDRYTCINSIGQVQVGWPHVLALCPAEIRPRLLDLTFRVLSHELGHVLNIVGHPADPTAVMGHGGEESEDMFRPVDLKMFAEANPGFVVTPRCARVVRSARPDNSDVGQCVCEDEIASSRATK